MQALIGSEIKDLCAMGVCSSVAKDILSIESFSSYFVFYLWHLDGYRQSTISFWPIFDAIK